MSLYYQLKKWQGGSKEVEDDICLKFCPIIRNLSKKLEYEEGETDLTIAFLEFIKKIDLTKFEKKDRKIAKFICKFLKNKSIDLLRKHRNKRKEHLHINYDILFGETPDFNSNIFISYLLDSLPPMQRTIIIKKFLYQYTDREISELLGISRQAVNRTKNRGLKNLRKELTKGSVEAFGRRNTGTNIC
ncbi:sigma-70 family RNA polymerase sigma factor [Wukongibacter baidiensis]|uniref:RNA polymerase sigma factor n=1 Tax=Wukongibacter baidiensis TaxID=1723361 RepID=UPI003D7FAE3F